MSDRAAREREASAARLLIALCRRQIADDATLEADAQRLDEPAFRAAFLAFGEAGRVLALALHALERGGLQARLHPESAATLRTAATRLQVRAAAQAMEHERVLAQLVACGIDVVLLKGAALRRTVYARAEHRFTRDLDLLVAPAHVTAAVDALTLAGYAAPAAEEARTYVRHHFHVQLRHARGHLVELHWALTEPESPVRLDAAAVLRGTGPAPGSTSALVRVPSTAHMLLHLAAQSATDGTRPLARLVDVDRLVAAVPELDWERLIADARRAGVATALGADLSLAASLLGAAVPPSVAARLRPSALVRTHLSLLRPSRFLLAAAPPRASELRLLQLWTLAGDHGVLGALRWLETQGFAGPLGRAEREDAEPNRATPNRGRRRTVARLKLGAYQLARYAAWLRPGRRGAFDTR